jgi:hypothetical protein
LLAVGIGINSATVNRPLPLPAGGPIAGRPTTESIVEFAVSIGEATDVETIATIGRHLAALNGFPLGSPQAEAIEHEIGRRLSAALSDGEDG